MLTWNDSFIESLGKQQLVRLGLSNELGTVKLPVLNFKHGGGRGVRWSTWLDQISSTQVGRLRGWSMGRSSFPKHRASVGHWYTGTGKERNHHWAGTRGEAIIGVTVGVVIQDIMEW